MKKVIGLLGRKAFRGDGRSLESSGGQARGVPTRMKGRCRGRARSGGPESGDCRSFVAARKSVHSGLAVGRGSWRHGVGIKLNFSHSKL